MAGSHESTCFVEWPCSRYIVKSDRSAASISASVDQGWGTWSSFQRLACVIAHVGCVSPALEDRSDRHDRRSREGCQTLLHETERRREIGASGPGA